MCSPPNAASAGTGVGVPELAATDVESIPFVAMTAPVAAPALRNARRDRPCWCIDGPLPRPVRTLLRVARDSHDEAAPAANGRFDAERSSVQLHDCFRDVETEPNPRHTGGGRAVEGFEDARAVGDPDAWPAVAHRDPDRI